MVAQWIIDQIGEPPEKPPTDPEAYASFPHADKERWREWNRKEDELIQRGFAEGKSLTDLGYSNAPDQGKSKFSQYGEGGFFMQNGANADLNWRYDWGKGRKYNIATSDQKWNENNPNGVAISESEWQGYRDMKGAQKGGVTDYSQYAGGERMKSDVRYGHFTKDPKSGLMFNIGHGDPNNPSTWQWKDKFSKDVSAPGGTNVQELLTIAGGPGGAVSPEGGGGMGGYGGYGEGGMSQDDLAAQFGLARSMESYGQKEAYNSYLRGMAGSLLGVKFDTENGGYSQVDPNAPPDPNDPASRESSWMQFMAPQLEQLGGDMEAQIERAKREGRPQDIQKIIQSGYQQKASLRDQMGQTVLQTLSAPDPYSELPGYLGQAGAQLDIANMDNATRMSLGLGDLDLRRYQGDQQHELGMSDLQLREALGYGNLDLQRELGQGSLEMQGKGQELQRELAQMGDKTSQRGQDIQKELALLGYAQQDKQGDQAFYGNLGQSGISLLGGLLQPGGLLNSKGGTGGTGGGGAGGNTGIFGGVGNFLGSKGGGALAGAGVGTATGGSLLGSGLGGALGSAFGPLGSLAGGWLGGKVGNVLKKVPVLGKLFSDITTKEDILPYYSGLDELRQMEPISYTYSHEMYGSTEDRTAGVAAQDLIEVLPEAVSVDLETGKMQVDYSKVLMTTVNATKELADELDKLQASLASKYPKSKSRRKKA